MAEGVALDDAFSIPLSILLDDDGMPTQRFSENSSYQAGYAL
jgi:hypothetical protein